MASYGTPEFRDGVARLRAGQPYELRRREHHVPLSPEANLAKAGILLQTAQEISVAALGSVRADLTLYQWNYNSLLDRLLHGQQRFIGGPIVRTWNLVGATAPAFGQINDAAATAGLALSASGDLYTYTRDNLARKNVLNEHLKTPESFIGNLAITGYSDGPGLYSINRELDHNTRAVEHYLMQFAAEKL